MSENFDIGPLTWVKDQINQSLDAVLGHLNAVQNNLHDTSPLRLSQTDLYQASGALDMVGLEGCKRFCAELEKLASRLEKKTLEATPELIEAFVKAVQALQAYLQDLLDGSADIPLRLYPVIQPIVLAMGESMDESELFFPDTSNSAPKDLPSMQLSDVEYASFMVQQRLAYQKSLLGWLQTKQSIALTSMTEAVSNVSQAQQKNSAKTLWWAASAFTESLEQKEIAENSGAKRLCRKLDQELRQLSQGIHKPHNQLLRDILYYVAISDVDRVNVQRVKEVFELDLLVDKKSNQNFDSNSIDANELEVVQQLIAQLDVLRELWDSVSNTIDFSKVNANASLTQVHIDNVLMTKFSDTLTSSQALTNQLSQVVVIDLYAALQQASNTLRDDETKVNHAALIEIAAALNLLETSLNNYQQLDADRVQKLLSEMRRLEAISSGESNDKLENERAGELDKDTVKAVVTQIKEALKTVEQALDSFFRQPAEKAPLAFTAKPLKQIAAVFEMLGLPTPNAIIKISNQFVELFQTPAYEANQAQFELVAESISMIGLYTDEMPKTRPESEQALELAVTRLNAALQEAGITPNLESIEESVAESATTELLPVREEFVQNAATSASIVTNADDVKVIDQAFDAELLDIYLTEAEEVLAHIAQNCQALRVNATDSEALIEVRRSYHTLKGSGRTVGLNTMGDIAGQVEQFLNGVLDKKATLSAPQIAGIEQMNAAFAGWASELRANNQAEVNQTAWSAHAAALSLQSPETSVAQSATVENTKPEPSAKKVKKPEPQVLIGGTRKMSRAFYDIFVKESMQNITAIEQDVANLLPDTQLTPSAAAKMATHTLGSNALAAGFKPMGELGRALEAWLDETQSWTPQHTSLYDSAAKSLSAMWVKVSELRNPRSARALIQVLNDATEQAKQHQALTASFDETAQTVEEITFTLPSEVDEPTLAPTLEILELPTSNDALEKATDNEFSEIDSDDYEVKLATESITYSNANENPEQSGEFNNLNKTQVDQELLTMFIEEAREILPEIGTELRAWRVHPQQSEHPDALQRSLHTLKGSARMAGQSGLGDAVHEMEDLVIRSLKRKAADIDFDSMFVDLDKIGGFFEQAMESTPAATTAVIKKPDAALSGRATDRKAQFLRMRADTLDRLINDAGKFQLSARAWIERFAALSNHLPI